VCECSGLYPPARNESEGGCTPAEVRSRSGASPTDHDPMGERFECEHTCWDPKDGELCLSRAKPGETLVEARSDSNVQIDRRTWV
jgi:hypothetical protein